VSDCPRIKRRSYPLICLLAATLFFDSTCSYSAKSSKTAPHKIVAGDFSSTVNKKGALPAKWRPLVFPRIARHTIYKITGKGKDRYLQALSKASASGLSRSIDIEGADYPILSWRWKIAGIIKKGDARLKSGDDYAARIYVTFAFEPSRATIYEKGRNIIGERLFGVRPPGSAINYIWANKLKKDEFIVNSYSNRDMMIAVESGNGASGSWVREERNIYEDYIKAFGHKPPPITGIAVMTDSDNTGSSAEAYYENIVFRKKGP